MRELKFKAQNKEGNWVFFTIWDINPPLRHENFRNLCEFAECTDVHENDIYENDLVKCTYRLNGETAIGIVKMIDGCWSVDFTHLPYEQRPFDPVNKIRRDFNYLKMFSSVLHNSRVVVGNIYDNNIPQV